MLCGEWGEAEHISNLWVFCLGLGICGTGWSSSWEAAAKVPQRIGIQARWRT